jgi:hypothetical protein
VPGLSERKILGDAVGGLGLDIALHDESLHWTGQSPAGQANLSNARDALKTICRVATGRIGTIICATGRDVSSPR